MKITSIKCPNCGANTNIDEEQGFGFCSYCGTRIMAGEHVYQHVNVKHSYEGAPQGNVTYVTNNYYMNNEADSEQNRVSPKSRTVALILCIFFGYLGIHHFYVGRAGFGILYIFTAGICGIGWIVDFFVICGGTFKDKN